MSTLATVSIPARLLPRRWAALCFIALAQLMVVLDATVVNIALPSAQQALGISDADRQWVITAYTLVFGGLLLLGGRIADLVGRRRTFLVGLVGFAAASALGGAAVNAAMLFGARALQGAFGALLAPSALSLLTVMFTEVRERAKAFGVYGAIAGGGAAVGLILGGVLTEYLNWRWALYANVPIAVVAFTGALVLVRVPPAHAGRRPRLDVPGAVLVTAGLVSLVYGFSRAESDGWRERGVIGLFAVAAVLLVLFVVVEALTRAPLLPLRVVLDRDRGGAYLAVGLSVIAMFGLFLFLTYYLQVVKGYSPLRSGLAFLPFTVGMIAGSVQIAARLMHRVPARALMVPGLLVAGTGMWLLTHLRVDTSYAGLVLPAEILIGLGLGLTMMPAMNLATSGVAPGDAGVASAMVNTAQQVGGSIGTALLNTIAATATTAYLTAHARGRPSPRLVAAGQVHGYAVAIWWGVGIILLTAFLVATVIRGGRPDRGPAGDARAPVTATPATASSVIGAQATASPLIGTSGPGAAAAGAPIAGASTGGTSTGEAGRVEAGERTPDPHVLASVGAHHRTHPGVDPAGHRPGHTPAAPFTEAPSRGRITGRVHGAAGPPVDGTLLTLVDLEGRQLARTTAEHDGSYALPAPAAGPYVLIATAAGHRPHAATVVVGDEPLAYDLTLEGTAGLAGVVRAAESGAPVAGAMVVLADASGEVVASGEAGPDGAFAFHGLASRTLTLVASAHGYRPAAVMVEVPSEGIARQDLRLPAGALVRGTVQAGAEKRPLGDARVTLVDAAGEVIGTAVTGADGEYAFMGLDAGTYTVIASGYPPVATALTVDGSDRAGLDITLGHPDR